MEIRYNWKSCDYYYCEVVNSDIVFHVERLNYIRKATVLVESNQTILIISLILAKLTAMV